MTCMPIICRHSDTFRFFVCTLCRAVLPMGASRFFVGERCGGEGGGDGGGGGASKPSRSLWLDVAREVALADHIGGGGGPCDTLSSIWKAIWYSPL